MKKFNKNVYRAVGFERERVFVGMFVRFYYGVGEQPILMDGVVQKIFDKGVECLTEHGYHFPMWDKISKMYIPKKKQEVVGGRTRDGLEQSSIVDGILERINELVKFKYEVTVSFDKVDLSTKYRNEMRIGRGDKKLVLIGEDGKVSVLGGEFRKKTFKVSRENNRVNDIMKEIDGRLDDGKKR